MELWPQAWAIWLRRRMMPPVTRDASVCTTGGSLARLACRPSGRRQPIIRMGESAGRFTINCLGEVP